MVLWCSCKLCDPDAAPGPIPGSREAPYQTLQFAVDNRAAHAVEATGNCVTINLMEGEWDPA